MNLTRRVFIVMMIAYAVTPLRAVTYIVPPDDVFIRSVDAIIVADTVGTFVEESSHGIINTVVVLGIRQVLKGGLANGTQLELRVTGGVMGERVTFAPGTPQFASGDRSLLFLRKIAGDQYAIADLGLGAFLFQTDDIGRTVLVRTAVEPTLGRSDAKQHPPQRRDAAAFVAFVRDVLRQIPVVENYLVDERPLIGDLVLGELARPQSLIVAANAAFTVRQYTLGKNESTTVGSRWKSFPVSWNKGNSQPGASNGGSDAIAAAFNAWNGDFGSNVTYVLGSANVNGVGADDFAPDSVNNIVFEKNMVSTVGIAPFSCTSGGVFGYCIITAMTGDSSSGDSTNFVGGEQFFSTTEADISINQGVGACIGVNITVANYNTGVAHELGHSLSFRHSNTTRNLTAACSTMSSYDCASSALMTANLASGNAMLQAWDQRAAAALYPNPIPAPPTGLVGTATTSTSVALSWAAAAFATSYDVYRKAPSAGFAFLANSTGTAFVDGSVLADTAYLYTVRAKNASGSSSDSNMDLATTVIFTDDPLSTSVSIKAEHLAQLRRSINAIRAQANLAAFAFADPAAAGVVIKALHLTQLRDALAGAALTATGGYTDVSLAGVPMKAVHLQELRDRVK